MGDEVIQVEDDGAYTTVLLTMHHPDYSAITCTRSHEEILAIGSPLKCVKAVVAMVNECIDATRKPLPSPLDTLDLELAANGVQRPGIGFRLSSEGRHVAESDAASRAAKRDEEEVTS